MVREVSDTRRVRRRPQKTVSFRCRLFRLRAGFFNRVTQYWQLGQIYVEPARAYYIGTVKDVPPADWGASTAALMTRSCIRCCPI